MRRPVLALLAILAMASLTACGNAATAAPSAAGAGGGASSPAAGGSGSGSGSAGSAAACAVAPAGSTATVTASIKNFTFSPQPIEAKVGDIVAWKNDDSAPHSATMNDGSCDTDTINPGSTGMLVFTAPGTYTYHCKIHPTQMKDVTVEVK
jgi:plastocyanin